MSDNISIKNRIKHLALNLICSFGKRRNEIIFESHPDFSCNTYEVFNYMVNHELLADSKFVWIMHDMNCPHPNYGSKVECIELNPHSTFQKLKTYFRKYNARCIISCNSIFPKFTGPHDQLHFFLDHGSQLKDVRVNNKRIDLDCDYYFSQSTFFNPFHLQQYAIRQDQIITTGLPRDDQFYRVNNNIHLLIPNINDYSHVIVWLPTFRKHYLGKRVDCNTDLAYGVPILHDDDDVKQFVSALEATNTLLLIKPHPAQDVSALKKLDSGHIMLIYNRDLQKQGIQLNELLSQTSAMITDYSSVYYDYLEHNRPIGITLDDFDEYSKQKGFVFDDVFSVLKGSYIHNVSELVSFIHEVDQEIDPKGTERENIRKEINDFSDGLSTKRVCDFIVKKLDEQSKRYK